MSEMEGLVPNNRTVRPALSVTSGCFVTETTDWVEQIFDTGAFFDSS